MSIKLSMIFLKTKHKSWYLVTERKFIRSPVSEKPLKETILVDLKEAILSEG